MITPAGELGKAYERKGDVLIQRSPKHWSAARELGRAYKRNGDDDAAVSGFRKILDLDPNNRWVIEELANAYKRKGDVEAASALSSALNLSDSDSPGDICRMTPPGESGHRPPVWYHVLTGERTVCHLRSVHPHRKPRFPNWRQCLLI